MRILLYFILPPFLFAAAQAQPIDSTMLLFNDAVMHEYNISFYTEHWVDSLLHYYNEDEEYIPARVEYRGMVFDSVGVRYKGSSSFVQSRSSQKKSFKFKFDKYKSEQSCFGVTRLNFSNGMKDPTFMREKISYDILGTILPSPRAAYSILYIQGEMFGLYTQVEQVDKKFLLRNFPSNKFNLYKAGDKGASLVFHGSNQDAYKKDFVLKTNNKADDWSRLLAMIQRLNSVPAESFIETVGAILDLDNCLRMNAFNMAASNFDSYTGSSRNFYLYDDESQGRFFFIPWDLNESFGAFGNDWNVITQDILNTSTLNLRPAFSRILENDSLRKSYLDYIRSLAAGPLSLDSIAQRVAHWKTFLDPWVQADPLKLYSYQQFLDNIENDVVVGVNMTVPGLLRFSRIRSDRVIIQADAYIASPSVTQLSNLPILEFGIYPNPATDYNIVRFQLLYGSDVSLVVFNSLGKLVLYRELGYYSPGTYELSSLFEMLSTGTYHIAFRVLPEGDITWHTRNIKLIIAR